MKCFKEAMCVAGITLAALYLMSPKANAAEEFTSKFQLDTIGVHIGSHHFPQKEFNNDNPGMYLAGKLIAPDWATGRYVIGAYRNSERKDSYYVGRIYSVSDNLDVVVGAITGYKAGAVLPLVVSSVHFRLYGALSARIHYLPKVGRDGANVLHLSLESSF